MNPTTDYQTMSSTGKFDSVDSILDYLRAPSPAEVVSSSTTSTAKRSTKTKRIKKEKELAIPLPSTSGHAEDNGQVLPSGRVRYGPITVNPRKKPSKTLHTGRRSKYEPLVGDEEEKRRLRRDRNRIAATKCREKRENVLTNLEIEYSNEEKTYQTLCERVSRLEQRKQYIQSILSNHLINCPPQQQQQQSTMVFGDSTFLTDMTEAPALPLPPQQEPIVSNREEEFTHFLQPAPILTNSAYGSDQSNYYLPHDQQSQPQAITMNSSIERLINSLQSPPAYVDSNNNLSGLFNSAYGTATCAQQHSSSSEDDSLPPTHKNSYVC